MAAVWAARLQGSRGFQRVVAIKTILPNLVDDPAFEQMFLDEAALASQVRHPHVAQILDLGEEDDVLYLVMEWVDGESLSVFTRAVNKLTGEPVPIPIASRIVMQAAAGLHAAHELRNEDGESFELVHRDVSPQNILLTYDGAVKIVDFGVAKAVGMRSTETSAGQIKGKVPYMSPEQALGRHIDRRTDIFALGTIFYQLVTGKHPFRGENDLETLKNITERPVLRPHVVNPNVPAEIDEVIATALSKDVDQRYPTMAAFEAALGAALAKLGMVTSDSTVAELVNDLLGGRAKKRRDALKQAMQAADEQKAGSWDIPLAISPSHSGLTPPPGSFSIAGRGERTSVASRRLTPGSIAAVATEAPMPPIEIAEERPWMSKRAALVTGAIAIAAVVILGLVAMGRGAKEGAGVGEGAGESVAATATAGEGARAGEGAVVEKGADEGVAVRAEAAAEGPVFEESQIIDIPAVRESGRGSRPHVANERAPAPVDVQKAPAAAPKRRKMPEVQDPGF